jgi:hypothetical protein
VARIVNAFASGLNPMTPSSPTRTSPKELDWLQQLEAVLTEESVALKNFDVAAIERAAAAKEELERQLEALAATARAPLSNDERAEVRQTKQRVSAMAHDNLVRLRVTLDGVRSLTSALTGGTTSGYGPSARRDHDQSRPVLTSVVG